MEYKRLGDIATYINGYAFKPEQWSNKGKPIIRIQNLNNKDAEYNYFDGEIDEKYLIKKGDVLISWSASIGVYEWDLEDAYLNQHIFKVVFDKEEIDKKYFKFMVNIALNKAVQYMHGSTMKHITKKYFDNILVPVPSLDKQKKIAEVLDKAQFLIDKKKEQIELLDELVKSRFVEMFGDPRINPKGWKIDKLENLTYKITDGKHGDCKNEENSGYYFISAKDINNRKINTDNARQITKNDFIETNKRTDLREKDLVVVNTGSIGKTAIATKSDVLKNLTFQKSVAIITTNDKVLNSEFLENYIIFDLDNICRSSSGTAQKNWLLSQIRGYKIILPPIELQNEFAEFVTKIDSIRSKMETSLSELEDNFNSLMQKAFKGELF